MNMDKEKIQADMIGQIRSYIIAILIFTFILTFLLGYFVGKWKQREDMWLGGTFIHGGDIYKVEEIK